jgi:hypothetical protein
MPSHFACISLISDIFPSSLESMPTIIKRSNELISILQEARQENLSQKIAIVSHTNFLTHFTTLNGQTH